MIGLNIGFSENFLSFWEDQLFAEIFKIKTHTISRANRAALRVVTIPLFGSSSFSDNLFRLVLIYLNCRCVTSTTTIASVGSACSGCNVMVS